MKDSTVHVCMFSLISLLPILIGILEIIAAFK